MMSGRRDLQRYTYPLTDGQVYYAVQWWRRQMLHIVREESKALRPLLNTEEVERFALCLEQALKHWESNPADYLFPSPTGPLSLFTDYGACGALITILKTAGLDPRNMLIVPSKTHMELLRDGSVRLRSTCGYNWRTVYFAGEAVE